MLSKEHRDRLQRAQTESMEHWIEHEDPAIIMVENKDSGSVHSIVPGAMKCSCPDNTYRNLIDKHILYVLQQDDKAGDLIRDGLRSHADDLKDEYEQLQDELRSVEEDLGQVHEIIDIVNDDRAQIQELTEDTIHQ